MQAHYYSVENSSLLSNVPAFALYEKGGRLATAYGMPETSDLMKVIKIQCCPGLPCQFLGILHVPVCGYMLPNLSPNPNLYKVRSVYNNNVAL